MASRGASTFDMRPRPELRSAPGALVTWLLLVVMLLAATVGGYLHQVNDHRDDAGFHGSCQTCVQLGTGTDPTSLVPADVIPAVIATGELLSAPTEVAHATFSGGVHLARGPPTL